MAHLVVIEGRRRGAVLPLEDIQRLGRDPAADLRLDDHKISRLHIEIARQGDGYVLRDLDSRNGTQLNGARCSSARLRNGDEITLGTTTLVYVDEGSEGTGSTPGATRVDETRIASEPAALIGDCEAMVEIHRLVRKAAKAPVPVLVGGESGTGKELVAQAIHRASERAGELIPLNCSTLHGDLLNSELFGHEKGAFTGAVDRHAGAFERAGEGTLFLDEIGELPPETQASLLRVVEGKGFTRVGGTEPIVPRCRLIAATHRDLKAAAGEGRFREDLYYRLAVLEIRLPPLRERGEDIGELARYFLERARRRLDVAPKRFGDDALAALVGYGFPGNVRELRNIVERLAILCERETVGADDLPAEVTGGPAAGLDSTVPMTGGDDEASFLPLQELERIHIERALELTGGNKSRAARLLGIDRMTLYNRLKRYQDDV